MNSSTRESTVSGGEKSGTTTARARARRQPAPQRTATAQRTGSTKQTAVQETDGRHTRSNGAACIDMGLSMWLAYPLF